MAAGTEPVEKSSQRSPTKVLVVDDDQMITKVVTVALGREGFEVFSANDGFEGLEVAGRELPDIVILDVEMPGIRGPEVCQKLRSDPRTAGIPVLFLTASVDLDAMSETLEENAQGYILKPLSVYDLLVKIDEVLGRSEL